MRKLCMKNKDGYWVSKKSIPNVVFTYLCTNNKPNNFLTDTMNEAKIFNWFSYGFAKFIFDSYDIYVRESFIQYLKI